MKPDKKSFLMGYSQLRFEGFSVKERNKIQGILVLAKSFIKALGKYVVSKIGQVLYGFGYTVVWVKDTSHYLKDLLISKLIWSRGRLGRPIATSIVMFGAFLIFFFGELFSSTKFVSSQELHPDYLSSSTDIIPQKNIALTAIPDDRKGTEPFSYTVQGGDTLSSIGAKFRISVDALKYVNSLADTSVLQVGDVLTIPPVTGLIHKVASGDTLSSIAQKYDVPSQAIADFNYILDTSKLAVGTELVIPDGKVPEPVIPVVPAPGFAPSFGVTPQAQPSSNFCLWPSSVRIITQYFSWFHNGVDIASPAGTALPPLYACTSGVVTRSGWDPFGLGLHVRIDHGNGYETVYGHMSRVEVGYGARVSRGQVIGIMGNTGRSTGPHVHFMVIYNGVAQNPLGYMN
ncbi:MAG TPA: peptidoglycan DD-metalloendopeptidase family protein [bacterium]|nr:peptidoglycan DD-metalloendopeptidase family protein [bacterium]